MNSILKVSSSTLSTKYGEFNIHVYRNITNQTDHVALIKGEVINSENLITRVHSECLTGDVFASSRCDCGEQLNFAQQYIASKGHGIIIYLRNHEGRGIGISNKIRAYALQDRGLDTVEANMALGLPIDQRSYSDAAEILLDLNVKSIELLSNNPMKKFELEKFGITVSKLQPIKVDIQTHNKKYLETKKYKLGHLIVE